MIGPVIEWLLEEENPSVRYFTLTSLLNRPLNDPEVMSAKGAIMKAGVVPQILDMQNEDGSWGIPKKLMWLMVNALAVPLIPAKLATEGALFAIS